MTAQIESKRISVENILFATDFSKYSNGALPFALSIARKYGSKILVLHVIPFPPLGSLPPTIEVQSIAAQALREANEGLKGLESRMTGISHEMIVRKGDIWEELSAI